MDNKKKEAEAKPCPALELRKLLPQLGHHLRTEDISLLRKEFEYYLQFPKATGKSFNDGYNLNFMRSNALFYQSEARSLYQRAIGHLEQMKADIEAKPSKYRFKKRKVGYFADTVSDADMGKLEEEMSMTEELVNTGAHFNFFHNMR